MNAVSRAVWDAGSRLAELERELEALRISERRWRTAASVLPGYAFEYRFRPDGSFESVWVSDGAAAVYGCPLEQLRSPEERDAFVDPAWRPVLDARRRGLARGEPQGGEMLVHTSTGEQKWLDGSASPIRDPRTGTVIGAIGAVYDVTKRKLAELALCDSRRMLQTLAQSSADWLAFFDREHKCLFLNRPIPGLTPEPVVGASVEEFVPAEDRARVHEIFEHVMHTTQAHDFSQVYTDPQGQPHYLELRVRAVQSDERVIGAVVNITEVTELRAQQDTLRTQARIFETMREGVVLVDAASNVIRMTNPALDSMFGYRRGELLGQPVDLLFGMTTAQRKRIARRIRGNGPSELLPFEFECLRRDGMPLVVSCVMTPLDMGGADHFLAVINDVTERKRLEREIIEVANREQQRIGNDLHDGLGQDLTGIALMLRGVVAQLSDEGSAARLDVEDVIGLVNHAIESTRTLARGLSPVSAERGGLTAALQELAARASERYGMRVKYRSALNGPLALSDAAATHLYRIAQEALTNAVRHSRASEVTIGLDVIGDELQLRVDDSGRGFTHCPDGALGLGLKIMRYRAEVLGGDFVIETCANGGASVRCSCPLPPR